MSYLSVSTWSLHRLLGPLRWTAWDAGQGKQITHEQEEAQELSLLELPEAAARRGYKAVEVCHFHFPRTDDAYMGELRAAFDSAGVSFDTLLVDYGDLTSEDGKRRESDAEWLRGWIRLASLAGAKQARIIAGEASPRDIPAIGMSADALRSLAKYASSLGVRVVGENFKSLTSTGESCMKLLKETEGRIGFITDFGNFSGAAKYEELALTAPFSVSAHAKAAYDDAGYPDEAEFRRCLEAVKNAGFDGAYVLIYDGPGDMWAGLERIKRIVEEYVD